MSWFRNTNTQAQVNAAVSAGLTEVANKQAEMDRLRDEAAAEAARSSRRAKADLDEANRMSRRRSSDLEDKNFELTVEIANAQNTINQYLIEKEAFKRLSEKYSQKAAISPVEFQKEVALQIQGVKEELALINVPVPQKAKKLFAEKIDFTDPNNNFLEDRGFTWLESHGRWASKSEIVFLQSRKSKS